MMLLFEDMVFKIIKEGKKRGILWQRYIGFYVLLLEMMFCVNLCFYMLEFIYMVLIQWSGNMVFFCVWEEDMVW